MFNSLNSAQQSVDMNMGNLGGLMNQNMVQPYFPVQQSKQTQSQGQNKQNQQGQTTQQPLQGFNNGQFVYPSLMQQVPVNLGDNSLVMLDGSPSFPSYPNQFANSLPGNNAVTGADKRKQPERDPRKGTKSKKLRRRFGVKLCQVEGCEKLARSTTQHCAAHGGGRRCQKAGCTKAARGSTNFCIAHGGGRRCKFNGCTKSAQGSTYFCIAHGGGRRCKHQGCTKSARGPSGLCKAHGGGKKCRQRPCSKLAIRDSTFCRAHTLEKREIDMLQTL